MNLLDKTRSAWNTADTSDAVGARTLTNHGTVTFGPGHVGSTASFNGTNQYLTRVSDSGLQANGSFTIAAWFNMDTKNYNGIATKLSNVADPLHEWGLWYRADVSKIVFWLRTNGTTRTLTADDAGDVATGTWHFGIAGYDADANEMFIRVNGGTRYTLSAPAPPDVGSMAFAIGAVAGDNPGNYFDGNVGPVWLFNGVLTTGEEDYLFNGGDGIAYPWGFNPPSLLLADSLAGYDGTGSTVGDALHRALILPNAAPGSGVGVATAQNVADALFDTEDAISGASGAVWDKLLADHVTPGTFGAGVVASSLGDQAKADVTAATWGATITGYAAGTFGYIVGGVFKIIQCAFNR